MRKKARKASEGRPAFEVITDGVTYRIWANGRVDGFPEGEKIIINRIPTLMNQHACDVLSLSQLGFTADA